MLGTRVGIIQATSKNTPILYDWDASVVASVLDATNNPVTVNGNINKWTELITNNASYNMINNNNTVAAKLEEEVRNNITYRYIRNIRNTGIGHLTQSSGIIKTNRTVFVVFRQNDGDHTFVEIFMTEGGGSLIRAFHNNDHYGYISAGVTKLTDYSVASWPIRIWAIKFNVTGGARCLVPNPIPPASAFRTIPSLTLTSTPVKLLLGSADSGFPSSFCFYEVIVYDSALSDAAMQGIYNRLQTKWGIV